METSMLPARDGVRNASPLPNKPLEIRVTVPAQENVVLRALVRQAIPMLVNPEAHGKATRLHLAQTLAQVLRIEDGNAEDDEPDWKGPLFSDAEVPDDEGDAIDYRCPCDDFEWFPE